MQWYKIQQGVLVFHASHLWQRINAFADAFADAQLQVYHDSSKARQCTGIPLAQTDYTRSSTANLQKKNTAGYEQFV